MKENVFAIFFVLALVIVVGRLCIKCEDDKVYLDETTGICHKVPYCEEISGFDGYLYEEFGDITGSKEISEKEVYGDAKYNMCSYCFSKMDIEHRGKYLQKKAEYYDKRDNK